MIGEAPPGRYNNTNTTKNKGNNGGQKYAFSNFRQSEAVSGVNDDNVGQEPSQQ